MEQQPKFELGVIVMTQGVAEWIDPFRDGGTTNINVSECLYRHVCGDWGDMDEEDSALNNSSIETGGRLFSAYKIDDTTIWIITEADRSSTTILFPDEY